MRLAVWVNAASSFYIFSNHVAIYSAPGLSLTTPRLSWCLFALVTQTKLGKALRLMTRPYPLLRFPNRCAATDLLHTYLAAICGRFDDSGGRQCGEVSRSLAHDGSRRTASIRAWRWPDRYHRSARHRGTLQWSVRMHGELGVI